MKAQCIPWPVILGGLRFAAIDLYSFGTRALHGASKTLLPRFRSKGDNANEGRIDSWTVYRCTQVAV